MRRTFLLGLTLMLLLAACAGAQAESGAPVDLYELDEDQCVLTVRLPANATTGYQWDFEISNPELLELIASEYVADEAAQGMVGAGGTWAASFKSAGTAEGMGGRVALTLRYARPFEPETVEPAAGYSLDIWVVENG